MRHLRDMGVAEVEAFRTMMATERKASASTHNQALSALLFLYREVLNIDLPWLNNIGRLLKARHWLAFTSQFQSTPCAIHLPPTF